MNMQCGLTSILTGLIVLVMVSNLAASDSSELHKLFDDAWEYQLKESPLFATQVGDHRYDILLPEISLARFEKEFQMDQRFLERLNAIDRSSLAPDEQLDYDIFELNRKNAIKGYEFNCHLMPISQMGGFYVSFPQLPDQVPLNRVKDYENYISRLNGFKAYAQGHIELMTEGMANGYVLPAVVWQDVEASIRPHIVADATQSLLYKPFEKFPAIIGEADRQRLNEAGRQAIADSIIPGYQMFLTFMKEKYLPAARPDISSSSLPNGKAYYEYCVYYNTTLHITPQEVHNIGLSEVVRIQAEIQKILREAGFSGTVREYAEELQSDPRFYCDTSEQLLKEVSFIVKKIDGELPRFFKTLPRMPFGLKEVPAFIAPEVPTAYYHHPAGDGSRAGFYFVNTYDLKTRYLYILPALSLHETVPGHHLQCALQQEIENVPNFRKYSWFTAYGEGWALYAEGLGTEMENIYTDSYSRFGRLSMEIWRACRLVVDTGMHSLGWSRQQAIDYMIAHTSMSVHDIETEIDRYIVWPGQALAYKIGELKIRELRTFAQQELGEQFDIRQFHDVVLRNGSVPLELLETFVHDWVAKTKQ